MGRDGCLYDVYWGQGMEAEYTYLLAACDVFAYANFAVECRARNTEDVI